MLAEAGVRALSYRTVKRRLPGYAKQEWRDRLSGACAAAAQLGPSALMLYDVTTLWFETDTGDGFRAPGFSKERRLEPQIAVGLLTDAAGAPLMVDAFEGNRAETRTMIPDHAVSSKPTGSSGGTAIADAGMMSEQNLEDIENAGWSPSCWREATRGALCNQSVSLSSLLCKAVGFGHRWGLIRSG